MKDEIKEILDNFKIYEDRYRKFNETQFIIFYRDIHLLLDYITNLQQENKQLKDKIDKATKLIKENVYIDYYGVATFRSQKCVNELLETLGDKENE